MTRPIPTPWGIVEDEVAADPENFAPSEREKASPVTTSQLTEQDIEEMERTVEKATAEPWLKGHNPTSREPMEYIADAYSYGPPGLVHLVCVPVDGKPIDDALGFTAITGNGPTSEANAAFIARARSFVPRAIADLRRLREENERLARENGRLEADEVRVARLRLLAMDGESPRRKEQP